MRGHGRQGVLAGFHEEVVHIVPGEGHEHGEAPQEGILHQLPGVNHLHLELRGDGGVHKNAKVSRGRADTPEAVDSDCIRQVHRRRGEQSISHSHG